MAITSNLDHSQKLTVISKLEFHLKIFTTTKILSD